MKIKCCAPRVNYNGNLNFNDYWSDRFDCRDFKNIEELEKIKNKLGKLLSNDGKGKIGKTLYVSKGSNIPRHKMKEFVKDKNIKKTNIIENADTIVFDKKVVKDILSWFKNSKKVNVTIFPFTDEIISVLEVKGNESYKKYYKKNCNILIYDAEYQKLPKYFLQTLPILEWKDYYEVDNYRTQSNSEVWDNIELCLKNPNANVIWGDQILEALNSDGIDLDNEYIDTLNSMFASNSSENIKLAFEMLSNVNLEKFGLSVALLLNRWKDKINWGSRNTSSQAYKILERYFKNKEIDWKGDFRVFCAGLYKNFQEDENAKETIAEFVLFNINLYLRHVGNQNTFLQINNFKIGLNNK